ncbi:hypothetical protein ACLOJK_000489 [Asimina triloba]
MVKPIWKLGRTGRLVLASGLAQGNGIHSRRRTTLSFLRKKAENEIRSRRIKQEKNEEEEREKKIMARDSCLARVTTGVAVGGAVGGAVGKTLNPSFFPQKKTQWKRIFHYGFNREFIELVVFLPSIGAIAIACSVTQDLGLFKTDFA